MNNLFTPRRSSRKDLRLISIDTYSRIARPTVHAIATGTCPMIPSTVLDGLKAVATLSGFAVTRRGRSRDVAVTGAGREERCGGQDFEDADAAQCAPYGTRIVS